MSTKAQRTFNRLETDLHWGLGKKGRFKLMYKRGGQEQSENISYEEEATAAARRYSKLGYTNIRIIDLYDESGKEYFFKDGGGVDDDMPVIRTQFEEEEFEYAKGGSVAQYRLVPYKQRMEGYIQSVGEKQVVLSTTYDGAWEKANELLSSDKDFDTVYVEKLGKSVLSGKILGSVSLRGIIKYADGGMMAKGGEIKKYAVVDENTDRIYIRSSDKEFIDKKYKELKEIYPNDKLSIIEFADGGMMADGGGVESQYKKGVVLVKSAKASNDNDVYDILNDKWKKYKIVNSRAFDLETPYNRGWIDEGISINVYLLKDTETNKYYWDSDYIEAKKNKMADGGMMDVVNTEVISIKGNIMGTTSLELKIKGMKKYQDFIVYPISADEAGKPITIQSDTRFGYMDLSSGRGLMSQSHSNGAYSYHFSSDRKVPFKISEIDVQKIKQHLSSRAGSKVGNSVVFSDNSGAGMMADGGGVDEDMPVIRTQFEEEEFEYAKGGVVTKKGSEWAFWAGLLGLGILGYIGINKK